MPMKMTRAAYADMFDPTVGDKVRLADTDLVVELEKDLTTCGEEVKVTKMIVEAKTPLR